MPHTSVLVFDFMACGNTEEGYVTLGLEEKDDLHLILMDACKKMNFECIILWGRSMGAVTIIHYLHAIENATLNIKAINEKCSKLKSKTRLLKGEKLQAVNYKIDELDREVNSLEGLIYIGKRIKGLVLDSPFTSSNKVVRDILKKQKHVPHFISKMILLPVKGSLKKNVGCDVLGSNKPKYLVNSIRKPAVFMIGDKDQLISMKRFKQMFGNYGGKRKFLRIMKGIEHNDFRNEDDIKYGVEFVKSVVNAANNAVKNQNEDTENDRIEEPIRFHTYQHAKPDLNPQTPNQYNYQNHRNADNDATSKNKQSNQRTLSYQNAEPVFYYNQGNFR